MGQCVLEMPQLAAGVALGVPAAPAATAAAPAPTPAPAAAPLAVVVRYHLKLRRCRCGGRSRALRRSCAISAALLLLPAVSAADSCTRCWPEMRA